MWSIHPQQIRPIVDAFAPSAAEVDLSIEILMAAQAADWAPIRHRDVLHDRASYRYFWHVLARAHRTGQPLPLQAQARFFAPNLKRAWRVAGACAAREQLPAQKCYASLQRRFAQAMRLPSISRRSIHRHT